MTRLKVFLSSVQSEFASERQMLFHFLTSDALLGRFFDVFLFENLPAKDRKASEAYLDEVRHSDVYLGLFGSEYGYEEADGVSPTEREFDIATAEHKIRLIFISSHDSTDRNPKMLQLIRKAEGAVIRKRFTDVNDLRSVVYTSLVNLLEEKELIRTGPFDATICREATLADIDPRRLEWFVTAARAKRGFPLSPGSPTDKVLLHLHLMKQHGLTNAALLLFGKDPQKFFPSSEVRCAMFHGNEIIKPIPSYQVYRGDLFHLVDQAVDFVLSRIDLSVGDRSQSVDVPVQYEIPRAAVAEAIVNAVAHRDYTSNGSVQVMLFRNRLEVWNPGHLPHDLTIPQLKRDHESFPANPLLAESLYLAGYIERLGTGTTDMLKNCVDAGLREPDFIQEAAFKAVLWRKPAVTPQAAPQVTPQAAQQATQQVKQLVLVLHGEMNREELQESLQLKDRENFRKLYLNEGLATGVIEMTLPDKPTSPVQKYRLTESGKALQQQLNTNKDTHEQN